MRDEHLRTASESGGLFGLTGRLPYALVGIFVVLAVAVPWVVSNHIVALAIEFMLLAMLAMSLDLLMGYTGLVSFGHSAFYGSSAYIVALTLTHVSESTWFAIALGIVGATVVAVPIGYFSLKRHGIYFAVLTLAFSQLLYVAAFQNIFGITGGSNGIVGIPPGNLGIPGIIDIVPGNVTFYYLALGLIVLSFVIQYRIVHSPFGSVLQAIRENEERAKAAGYDVDRYKLQGFVVSGFFAGVAGSLYAPYYSAAAPEILFWFLSGEAVAIVILGGMGTLVGPILGAGLFITLREFTQPFLTDWLIVLGVVFIIFILYLPNGMVSIFRIVREKFRND